MRAADCVTKPKIPHPESPPCFWEKRPGQVLAAAFFFLCIAAGVALLLGKVPI